MGVFSASMFRFFDGDTFRKWGGYRTKAHFDSAAKRMAKQGFRTRHVKLGGGDHLLYVRKKRG